MSVLINIEMPTSCAGCFNKGCGLWREVVLPAHQRHKYCPLVPVPKHGRLIDADALLDEAYQPGAYGYVDAIQIENAPTIIPTSEEGE